MAADGDVRGRMLQAFAAPDSEPPFTFGGP